MAPIVLIHHAEPLEVGADPDADWPLTDKGKSDAVQLGSRLLEGLSPSLVLTSPDRRANETATLAFPSLSIAVRVELLEVTKPWYAPTKEAWATTARYLLGEDIGGWEPRDDLMARIEQLASEIETSRYPLLVTHGVFLTSWVDRALTLKDPISFWSDLRMPDAWELDVESKSLTRI